MSSDLSAYRASEREKARITDLFELIPKQGNSVLDVGARDGYLSGLLAERFKHVVALDLEKPTVVHPRIEAVKGDATALAFEDNTFDAVVCAEVLEHIPTPSLERACREIARVASLAVIVGVPYKQDIRCARTTCSACGNKNPPWGHVNSFDEDRLEELFPKLPVGQVSYVGTNQDGTNALSTALLDYAGNPYGTYEQDEPCVHCGKPLGAPVARTILQTLATKTALLLNRSQSLIAGAHANWIHVRFDKPIGTKARPQ
jgi:SAM-dependent methyltransferase